MLNWFRTKQAAWFWLVLRVYVGVKWVEAGWHKAFGAEPFDASGFIKGAIAKSQGAHPAVQSWYASFLENVALPNINVFNFLVAYGEVLVGLALVLGFATTFAAFMGALMNLNFMLAGSTSTNPILYTLQVLIIAGGAYTGYIGVDYWFRPAYRKFVDGLFKKGPEMAHAGD